MDVRVQRPVRPVLLDATIADNSDDISDALMFEPNAFARFQYLGAVDGLAPLSRRDFTPLSVLVLT